MVGVKSGLRPMACTAPPTARPMPIPPPAAPIIARPAPIALPAVTIASSIVFVYLRMSWAVSLPLITVNECLGWFWMCGAYAPLARDLLVCVFPGMFFLVVADGRQVHEDGGQQTKHQCLNDADEEFENEERPGQERH